MGWVIHFLKFLKISGNEKQIAKPAKAIRDVSGPTARILPPPSKLQSKKKRAKKTKDNILAFSPHEATLNCFVSLFIFSLNEDT